MELPRSLVDSLNRQFGGVGVCHRRSKLESAIGCDDQRVGESTSGEANVHACDGVAIYRHDAAAHDR
jgi:hypothetical protein